MEPFSCKVKHNIYTFCVWLCILKLSPYRFLTKDKLVIVVRILQYLIVQLFSEKLT